MEPPEQPAGPETNPEALVRAVADSADELEQAFQQFQFWQARVQQANERHQNLLAAYRQAKVEKAQDS